MENSSQLDEQSGEVILIDKPLHWTSFDAVNKLKKACKFKKIGHAGTLDPLATGLLVICTGRKTKTIESFQNQEKEYTGTLVLGKTTPSVDLETDFDATFATEHISENLLRQAALSLTGSIEQEPPIYSAVKVDGERLYKKARRGEAAVIKKRMVDIRLFEIDTQNFPEVEFRIVCSKGTYIRSLVRDFGVHLNSGAYLKTLRRTRIGACKVEDAWQLPDYIMQKRKALVLPNEE